MLPKAKISVEIERPGRQGLVELAAEADAVFYSRSWAEVSHGVSPRKKSKQVPRETRKGRMRERCGWCLWVHLLVTIPGETGLASSKDRYTGLQS